MAAVNPIIIFAIETLFHVQVRRSWGLNANWEHFTKINVNSIYLQVDSFALLLV